MENMDSLRADLDQKVELGLLSRESQTTLLRILGNNGIQQEGLTVTCRIELTPQEFPLEHNGVKASSEELAQLRRDRNRGVQPKASGWSVKQPPILNRTQKK